MKSKKDHRPPRRSWLCIAHSFPPIQRSGTHRTLGFVRHLDSLGWRATVLTAEVGNEPCDPTLLDRVPLTTLVSRASSPDVVRWVKRFISFRREGSPATCQTSAGPRGLKPAARNADCIPPKASPKFVDWATRLLTTPDSRVGWIFPALREGFRLLRRHRPEVMYSTSPCLSAHLIAALLSRWSRIPWVADFRDPWRDNPFRTSPFASIDAWDQWLERRVFHQANHVIFNTPTAAESAIQRLPWLESKVSTIGNGFDEELVTGIRPRRLGGPGEFILTHAGEFYGRRSPEVLFSAISKLQQMAPEVAATMRVVLLGPREFGREPLDGLARKAGVASSVRLLGRKSHAETLAILAGSDAVLVVGASGPGSELQVPNKLYECLALRRPILAAVSENNPTREVLSRSKALACTCLPDDVAGFANALKQLVTGRVPVGSQAWSGAGQYERKHRAAELCAVLERCAPLKANSSYPTDKRNILATGSARRSAVLYRKGSVDPGEPSISSAVCSSIQPD
ncbi:MAG: glycosyltransferase [Planctomycetota bacterium]